MRLQHAGSRIPGNWDVNIGVHSYTVFLRDKTAICINGPRQRGVAHDAAVLTICFKSEEYMCVRVQRRRLRPPMDPTTQGKSRPDVCLQLFFFSLFQPRPCRYILIRDCVRLMAFGFLTRRRGFHFSRVLQFRWKVWRCSVWGRVCVCIHATIFSRKLELLVFFFGSLSQQPACVRCCRFGDFYKKSHLSGCMILDQNKKVRR